MPYLLAESSSLEQLLDVYRPCFKSSSVLAPEIYVVAQNKQTATFLQHYLAQTQGICANLRIVLAESALRELITGFEPLHGLMGIDENDHGLMKKPPLHANEVKLVLYKYLHETLSKPLVPEALIGLKLYIGYLTDPLADEKLYELCSSVASLFVSYGMNSAAITEAWNRHDPGEPVTSPHSQWQQFLWQTLFSQNHGGPYTLLSDLMLKAIHEQLPYSGSIKKIILLGGSFLGSTSLNFFHHISHYTQVYHLMVNPLDHLNTANEFLRRYGLTAWEFEQHKEKLRQNPQAILKHHPTEEPVRRSALKQLQQKISQNQNHAEAIIKDDSLRIYSCSSLSREVETAKDFIIKILLDNPGLKPQDIALVAPDINPYAPYIEAVFKRGSGLQTTVLPYSIVDLAGKEPITEAVLLLLNLPGSRFSRRDLFDLFHQPIFADAQGITDDDLKIWLNFSEELAVLWGVDDAHRQKIDLSLQPQNSWSWAFNHFLHTVALGPELDSSNPMLRNDELWPAMGRLITLINGLYQDFYSLTTKRQRFDQWITELEYLIRFYLGSAAEQSYSIKKIFRNMKEAFDTAQHFSYFEDDLFSYTAIKAYLKESAALNEQRKGQFLTGGVVCSSLKPLRSLPFHTIIIMGLSEGSFPIRQAASPYDLTANQKDSSSLFTLSTKTADRYLFLETVMAARQTLLCSYLGRSATQNQILEPSAVLEDLLNFADNNRALSQEQPFHEHPWVEHCYPIHPFNQQLYQPGMPFTPSYDEQAFELAQNYYGHKKQPTRLSVPSDVEKESLTDIDINDLIAFFKDPSRYYFEKTLSCRLTGDVSLGEDRENELFSFSFRQKNYLVRQLTEAISENRYHDHFIHQQIEEQLKKGVISSSVASNHQLDTLQKELALFAEQYQLYYESLNHYSPVIHQVCEPQYQHTRLGQNQYRLQGYLPPLYYNQEQQLFHLLQGTYKSSQFKFEVTAFFTGLLLALEPGNFTGLSAYGCTCAKTYTVTQFFKDIREEAPVLLDKSVDIYTTFKNKPLPFFPSLLDTNEMRNADHWRGAYDKLLQTHQEGLLSAHEAYAILYKDGIPEFDDKGTEAFTQIYARILGEKI